MKGFYFGADWKKIILFSWAIWFITLQLVTPTEVFGPEGAEANGVSSFHCAVCRLIQGLTVSQQNFCCEHILPTGLILLENTSRTIQNECTWQFRKELWNCSGIDRLVFKEPKLRETSEKAFIYALASATTVHSVTRACTNNLLPCGCDYSRNGIKTRDGWTWGLCSENVSYGIGFAQNFLDARELDVSTSNATAVSHAAVHLHNNAVGRNIVQDNMVLSCRCHGFSGSCAVKTCWRELPSYYQVGDTLKEKQANSLKVWFTPRHNGPDLVNYVDETRGQTVTVEITALDDTVLIHLEDQDDYCSYNENVTLNRECMPEFMLDAKQRGQVKSTSMKEHFPSCESFCCNGEFVEETVVTMENCNCRFVWCCTVECQSCPVSTTHYHCTG